MVPFSLSSLASSSFISLTSLFLYHCVSIVMIWNQDITFKVNSSTVLNIFFLLVKDKFNVFLKELCSSLIYISPYPAFVTYKRNFKKNLSFPYNINKLCGVYISLFLWWAKGNFRKGIVFRLGSLFSLVQNYNHLYTRPLNICVYIE